MKMKIAFMIFMTLILVVVAGCSNNHGENKLSDLKASALQNKDSCAGTFFLYEGIDIENAKKALAGDLDASYKILLPFLNSPSPLNDLELCQSDFWFTISAENGSLQSMYEIGLGGSESPILCIRESFWARRFISLANSESFRSNYRADVSLEDINADIAFRKSQLMDSINECDSLQKRGVAQSTLKL